MMQTGARHAVELLHVIEELGAVAGNAGGIAEPLRPEDRVGAAVAETHHRGLAVELRQRAQIGEHVDEIALAGLDLLEPRLRALLGAAVVMGQRSRQRAPEQIGRRGDDAVCGKFVGDGADVGIDAVDRGREHDGRHRSVGLGLSSLGASAFGATR